MSDRMLIDIDRVRVVAAGDPALEAEMHRALCDLADEINSALPEYECTLMHLDTADYLAFTRRPDPEEGAYWRELEEERQAMFEGAEDDD